MAKLENDIANEEAMSSLYALIISNQNSNDIEPDKIIEWYHQHIFLYFHSTHSDRIDEYLHKKPKKLRVEKFLRTFDPQRKYSGQEAWELCKQYLESLEKEIASILGKHSVAFWLHIYRRIGVSLSPHHDDKTDPDTVALVREVVELSISKYGNLVDTRDMGLSSKVHFKDILGGHYQRLWNKWIGKSAAKEKYEQLSLSNQWVAKKFSLKDFLNIYYVEGLSYEYWRVTALMRAIGKGLVISVGRDDWPEYHHSSEFSKLIKSYDSRINIWPFSSSLLGSWFITDKPLENKADIIWCANYNIEKVDASKIFRGFKTEFIPNFLPFKFDAVAYRDAHQFLSIAYKETVGFSLEILLLVLGCLSHIVFFPTRVLYGKSKENSSIADNPLYMSLMNLMQRGYGLFKGSIDDIASEIMVRVKNFEISTFVCSQDEILSCLKYLTLTNNRSEMIALWSGGKKYPIIKCENFYVIDLLGIPRILESLFYKIQYHQTTRGHVFEDTFRVALSRLGYEQPTNRKLCSLNGEEREYDAHVRINEKLIFFECRTIERPLDYNLARPITMKNRQEYLNCKVDQVLSLRDFILSNPVGRNYDFSWAKDILVFVVSPFVEWVWDLSSRLWHDSRTPRILKANEAIEFVKYMRGERSNPFSCI